MFFFKTIHLSFILFIQLSPEDPITDSSPDNVVNTEYKHWSSSLPERSLPMIPELCFATSTDNPSPFGHNTLLDDDGLSPLLVCEDCKVCVHASKFF